MVDQNELSGTMGKTVVNPLGIKLKSTPYFHSRYFLFFDLFPLSQFPYFNLAFLFPLFKSQLWFFFIFFKFILITGLRGLTQ